MKKIFLMILPLAILLLIASCSKDQKAVKVLAGSWKLVKQDAVAVPPEESDVYTFEECKLKNDEFCTLTIESSDTTETSEYKVIDDGETLVLKADLGFAGLSIDIENTITELTETTLKLDFNFIGIISKLEFTKL
ncbi:MAG: hypothetical protein AB8B74_11880 [Crocinitomicaceae bacterium]